MVCTEETAELGRCDWHEGWHAGVGQRYEPRRRGTFQIGADVSRPTRTEVPEQRRE